MLPLVDRPLRVDVRCNHGSYAGSFTAHSLDLLLPCRLSRDEFTALRRRLGGFHEVTKTFPASVWSTAEGVPLEAAIIQRLCSVLNVHVVQSSAELLLAGSLRRNVVEEKLLVTVSFETTAAA